MHDSYLPHGVCWLWNWKLILLHAPADLVTWAAYMVVPAVAFWIYAQGHIQNLASAFPHLWRWGAAFVFFCGLSHFGTFFEVFVGGNLYYLTGVNKVAMGAVSVKFAHELWKSRLDLAVVAKALDASLPQEGNKDDLGSSS